MSDRPLEEYSLPYLWKRIEELQFELSSYEESDANLQKKVKELEAKIEDIKDVYIDEHKRWAINCGDSSCCACMDLLSVLDAINDVLEIHGKPLCYEGVPVKFGFHT